VRALVAIGGKQSSRCAETEHGDAKLFAADFRRGAEHRLKLNPEDADARVELGVLHFIAGDEKDALAQWQRAARINPALEEPHYHMGVLFRKNHFLTQAKQELETAIRLNPGHSEAYGHLGFVMAELGDGLAAKTKFYPRPRIKSERRADPGRSQGIVDQLPPESLKK